MAFNKVASTVLVSIAFTCSSQVVLADPAKQGKAVEYEKHPYDIHEYYDNIPDLVNMTETGFWFY